MQVTTQTKHNYFSAHVGRNGQKDSKPFQLNNEFLAKYEGKKPKFGYGGLGEFVFYRTYSRLKPDGTKESFLDTICRVVEGCYEIQRRHCESMHIPWTRSKAQRSAQEMFGRMWDFKFLPPGRGLWAMGTQFMYERGSACLCNCGFVSTTDLVKDPAWPFAFMMDMSMLGVGVGFDTRGANTVLVKHPADFNTTFIIDDSREGWVDSLRALIESFTTYPERGRVIYDYSNIRAAGMPINGFGGTASGPDTLRDLHTMTSNLFHKTLRRKNVLLTSVDIVDLMNFIGRCIVAGNVRRTSELVIGDPADWDYVSMKDKNLHSEELKSHRWASNNSILAVSGMDYKKISQQIVNNGEPGLLWFDTIQNYGRIIDGRQPGIDKRAIGTNPCFAGNMRLLTADGYYQLSELWERTGKHQWSSETSLESYGVLKIINNNGIVNATNVYRTGIGVDLFRVCFSDGTHIDATANHTFIVVDGVINKRVLLSELQLGNLVPNHSISCHSVPNHSILCHSAEIISIEPIGKGDTYCLTEFSSHTIVIEGHLVGNCSEQSLESSELCNLVESFPAHHENAADYHRTLKFAYLYAKTVTLLPTHCKRTNAVLLRNRRIGLSQSGIIQAFNKFGRSVVLSEFCDKGYKVVKHWDNIYSEWLCISRSIKCTSVKPSGSVSLLAGSTAGIHFTIAPTRSYWRNVRVSSSSPLLGALLEAGYYVEPCITDNKTSVVRFGVSEPNIPTVSEISIWQQVKNVESYQRLWADNQVSCTIQFKPEEAKDIPYVLEAFEDELKSVSFLPVENHGYAQAPYQPATDEEVHAYNAQLKPLDFTKYIKDDAIGTKYCDNDTCTINL